MRLLNTPPEKPVIVTPYNNATMPDATGHFIWWASTDSDLGDAVTSYQLQIATDADFTNLLLSTAIAAQPSVNLARLNTLPGYDTLTLNARYYWRVRALDTRAAPSEWAVEPFIYGTLHDDPPEPPAPVTISTVTISGGEIHLSWTESALPVRIEFTPSLAQPQWTAIPGATDLNGTNISLSLPENEPSGFYRVVVEAP